MITYEKFREIIVKYINFYKCEDQLRKMNIDIFESPLFDTTGYFFDWLWEAYFTEDGCDTINWWAFEYHNLEDDFDNNGEYIGDPDKEPGMWDKDDNVIPMLTIKDLWNEVKDQRLKLEGEEDHKELKDSIKDMVELHLKTATEPVNMNAIKEAIGDEWDNIIKFFGKPENMVCVDNTDEAIADIMATYLENKSPYKVIKCEACEASIFLDSKVGVLLVLSADDYELYVWQG
jgi:hypothetical protein